MKKILLVLAVLLTQNIYSQAHIGVMGGYDPRHGIRLSNWSWP